MTDDPRVEAMGWRTALGIGVIQCLSMIPGVSRSGATIMGALTLGVDRKTAAEYSFFLAVPVMLAASAKELWEQRDALGGNDWSGDRDRLRRVVRRRAGRDPRVHRDRLAPRLRAVRLVSDRRRQRRADLAAGPIGPIRTFIGARRIEF